MCSRQRKFLQDSIVRRQKVVSIDSFWKQHLFPNYGVSTLVINSTSSIRLGPLNRTNELDQYQTRKISLSNYVHKELTKNELQDSFKPKVGTVSEPKCARMHVSAVAAHWTGNGNDRQITNYVCQTPNFKSIILTFDKFYGTRLAAHNYDFFFV